MALALATDDEKLKRHLKALKKPSGCFTKEINKRLVKDKIFVRILVEFHEVGPIEFHEVNTVPDSTSCFHKARFMNVC